MIPIYFLGIYIYQWGLNTVKNEISKSTIAQASFYLEGLENEIERIKILQYDCLNDENLNKLAIEWEIMEQYEIIAAMRQLQQRLITIRNSSEYIKKISIYIYPIKRTISAETGLDDFDIEKYENIRVSYGKKGAQIISYKGGLYLSTLQERNYSAENPLYLIEIELDIEAFRNAIGQLNTYKESGLYLVNSDNDEVIIYMSDIDMPFMEGTISDAMNIDSNSMIAYEIGNKEYYIVHAESKYLGMDLLRFVPKELGLIPLNNFYAWVWVFSLSAVAIIIIYSLYAYKLMHKPMHELIDSFREVEKGNLQVSISHEANNEFVYLYTRFNEMTRNLRTLIDQVYNQKILMQRAELKQLQSQINPHFLYNSFFMLNTMVRINDENLIQFTKYLGDYFRYITRNASDYSPLIEEINHAKVYVNIQLIRFSKRLKVEFGKCPENFENFSVPRLILQPIIENAFEHGLGRKKKDGVILVNFFAGGSGLDIIIEDNGNELSDEDLTDLGKMLESDDNETEITGIINIHKRIKLVFGKDSGLSISRSTLGGLKVKVMLRGKGGESYLQAANS
jgi:two-component system sensor histidine kinase YesM